MKTSMESIMKWSVTPRTSGIVSDVKAKQVLVGGIMAREKLGHERHVFPSQVFCTSHGAREVRCGVKKLSSGGIQIPVGVKSRCIMSVHDRIESC